MRRCSTSIQRNLLKLMQVRCLNPIPSAVKRKASVRLCADRHVILMFFSYGFYFFVGNETNSGGQPEFTADHPGLCTADANPDANRHFHTGSDIHTGFYSRTIIFSNTGSRGGRCQLGCEYRSVICAEVPDVSRSDRLRRIGSHNIHECHERRRFRSCVHTR